MSSIEKLPLVVIVGPTAVGKTEISIQLAEYFSGEIVSADSRLFYRHLDIGTAKPSPQDRLRVPHHLIDVTEPGDTWSLSLFQSAARRAIEDINHRGHLPFLVGGTGQYIHAVTHGWNPPATSPDPSVRLGLENLAAQKGPHFLHDELMKVDPEAAAIIDPLNVRRTIRALEVIRLTGKKFSSQRGRLAVPYHLLTIGLTRPRQELYARVDARIEEMFSAGLLDEVRGLLESGISPDLPALSSIGYRECVAVLNGSMTVEHAKILMRRATRVFVRRQANWFKVADPGIHWFSLAGDTLELLKELVSKFIAGRA